LAERDTICSNPSATIRLGSRAGMKQISGGHSPLMASAKFPRLVRDLRSTRSRTAIKAQAHIEGNGMAALKNRRRLIQFRKMEPRSPPPLSTPRLCVLYLSINHCQRFHHLIAMSVFLCAYLCL